MTVQHVAASATHAPTATSEPRRRRGAMALRAFARDRAALVAAIVLGLAILSAILAPVIAPYDPYTSDIANRLAPPLREPTRSRPAPI